MAKKLVAKSSAAIAAVAANLDRVMEWVSQRLTLGDAPRVIDMLEFAKRENLRVTRKQLNERLQQDPTYMFNLHQQKPLKSSRRYRPIIATNLGYLHADLGYFTKSRHYETPPTFQAGFLVCKDILSRFVYLVALRKTRTAEAIIDAFETVAGLHSAAGHLHPIRGVSFDQERSVLSKEVRSYFASNGIKLTVFKNTRSKAKVAEGAIRQIRTVMARRERYYQRRANGNGDGSSSGKKTRRRWWNLLGEVTEILNNREIVVDNNKRLDGFSPAEISTENVSEFLAVLYNKSPADWAAQFDIDPRHVSFRYPVGTDVRAKLIVTSSHVIGEKRSETNLGEDVFRILEAIPNISRGLTVEKQYRCVNIRTGEQEIFDENDIVPTNPLILTSDRHAPL